MIFYPFHIGDYQSHTAHLTPLEDITYRRLLDLYYLHEVPLVNDIDKLARLTRLQGHEAEIQNILDEFFTLKEGWENSRANREIDKYLNKSHKARQSAQSRWNNANAMRTQCEGNATITKTKTKTNIISRPTREEVENYASQIDFHVDPERFIDYYAVRGWKLKDGSPLKDWKAALRTWKKNQKKNNTEERIL